MTTIDSTTRENRADVVTLRPASGERTGTLFCVHGAGGSVMFMVPVARLLDPGIAVFGFQAHGFNPAKEPDTDVDTMAARYTEAILRTQPTGPYQVIGYSLGGVIAHEVARRLIEHGASVNLVGLLDTPFPGMSTVPSPETALELVSIALMFPELYQHDPNLSWDDQLLRFRTTANDFGILPANYDLRRLQRMVDLHRVNREAVERHDVRPLDHPVRLLVAADGLSVEAVPHWLRMSGEGSAVTTIDAEHFTLMTRNTEDVAKAVSSWL
jgi:thioesterase domain-containing protein